MTGPELTALLARAADDDGRPLRTDLDALLARARREEVRRRRRSTAALGAIAAGVVAVVAVPALLTSRPASGPAPTTPERTAQPLSGDTIVQRCRPQLAKYATYPVFGEPDPTSSPWVLAHPARRYAVGEVVRLVHGDGSGGSSVLCKVPAAGREDDAVPFADLAARAGDDDTLRQVCSEQTAGPDEKGEQAPDLRQAEVLTSTFDGQAGAALLRADDGNDYGCATTPVQWSADLAETGRVPYPQLWSAFGTRAGEDGASDTQYVVVAGVTSDATRTITLTWPGVPTRSFPVREGHVAVVLSARDPQGQTITYRELGADGQELGAGLLP